METEVHSPIWRDAAEVKALTQIYLIEDIIEHCIREGIEQERYYIKHVRHVWSNSRLWRLK